MRNRKIALLAVMILSLLPVFLAIEPKFDFVDSQAQLYFVARQLGLIGTIILFWQFMLGIRGLVSRLIPDLIWVNSLHQKLGKYGYLLIFFHPVLMFFHYMSVGINIIGPKFETDFDKYKTLGVIGFSLITFVWIASAILRGKVKFRPWKRIHFVVYIALPLLILHGLNIGMTLSTNRNLRYYWLLLSILLAAAIIYRLLINVGVFKVRYRVIEKKNLTSDTVQLTMQPTSRKLVPTEGQFIYIQTDLFGESHPFTVSHFDETSGYLSISPKLSGPFSAKLQGLEVGKTVLLDGPFGVFTKEGYTTERPLVILAGGIGITPFVRLVEKMSSGWRKEVHLFWGNKTESDIAFKEEFERAKSQGLEVIHVISNQESYSGEKGYITEDLLRKYLGDLTKYEYFVCGPPAMTSALLPVVEKSRVPANQIHAEKFSL